MCEKQPARPNVITASNTLRHELFAFIDASKQLTTTEFEMSALSPTAPKRSIPDRRIAMRYPMKGGMNPKHWAHLYPAEWERLVLVAPLKKRGRGQDCVQGRIA
jgi:hypothetical protein